MQDYELIAQEVNILGPRIEEPEERVAALAESIADVQKVKRAARGGRAHYRPLVAADRDPLGRGLRGHAP